jgi:2-oxoglutarate dehydrogenase E2 component (dihydrolipoamide succinyltransferase)
MAIEIRVPALGESISEATVGKWFKKAGEPVQADEPLVELETDKVTLEVNAPSSGVLSEIAAETGQTVAIGALLGQLSAGAATPAATSVPAAAAKAAPAPAAATPMPPAPAAAKLAAEDKIDLASVAGSGKRGQVLKGDVLAAVASARAPSPVVAPAPLQAPALAPIPASAPAPMPAARTIAPDDSAREERVRMTKLRQTIARRLKDAQNTAAMLTTFNEVDMSEVMALRARYKDAFEKKHGAKLGFMGFFVKACVQALKEVPAVNAEIDGADLVYKNYYHIGIAVGTDKGLIVPVVRDADSKSFAVIEKEVADYARKAREGSLTIAELTGGTFTITNGGVFGSLMSTPIVNAPQSAILGMHKIQERPMVVNGAVVPRPMMYLAVTYDHRIIDGREAVQFLVAIKESLEDPGRMLLGI